ncbi:PIN domain-containing protein [Paraburkholderia solisilvae]|uniref:DUF4935 domain-containing protein n=1 Tax=Paraburkholderia solisilvae TaxID=624376 RepID=A0A6J5EZP6_9BURK|nr:PIN domain-containing protein [Paraburkholderia solisilvae]CAB3770495.1 hypothetical protein LMG29739_05800 [Paraburkholderia solisilvae]
MNAPTKKSQLHIMFDANALWVKESGEDLIPPNISKIILDPQHEELEIRWTIPEMVQVEREVQLRANIKHIFGVASKMPKLFGATWLAAEESMTSEIARFVSDELARHGVEVVPCDTSTVNWASLIKAAGRRAPPFDPDPSKEKGFKDAVIAETFIQMAGTLPAHGTETAMFVSNDKRLVEHVKSRAPNTKFVSNADELASELNFLSSDVDPSIAPQIVDAAALLLDGATEFWGHVFPMAKHRIDLQPTLEGISNERLRHSMYNPPVFVKKEMRHVYFRNTYSISRDGWEWVPGHALGFASADVHPQLVPGTLWQEGMPYSASYVDIPTPKVEPVSFSYTAPIIGLSELKLDQMYGSFRMIELPPYNFNVDWRADFELVQDGKNDPLRPRLSNPFIESVEILRS